MGSERELLPQTRKFNKWKSVIRFQSILSYMNHDIYIITYNDRLVRGLCHHWRGRGGPCRAELCPRSCCTPRGGGCPGSYSGGAASSESRTLCDIYPENDEVWLEAKATFHFWGHCFLLRFTLTVEGIALQNHHFLTLIFQLLCLSEVLWSSKDHVVLSLQKTRPEKGLCMTLGGRT